MSKTRGLKLRFKDVNIQRFMQTRIPMWKIGHSFLCARQPMLYAVEQQPNFNVSI